MLSSGFLGAEAAMGAQTAMEGALQDLKEKYDKIAEEEAKNPPPPKEGEGAGAPGEGDKPDGDGADSDDDWLDDDPELDRIREKRLAELKEKQTKRKDHLALGHGEYREIVEEEFLPEVTGSDLVVCHFYHNDFERCKILDHHLRIVAPRYVQTKFIKINAEKTPFFVTKLGVRVLPTTVIFNGGIAKGRMTGFDKLGGDEFATAELEAVLRRLGAFKAKDGPAGAGAESDDESDGEERREGATVAELLEQRRAHVIKSMLAEDVDDDDA